MNLSQSARDLLELYLQRLRLSLGACMDVDAEEVAGDVRAHVLEELRHKPGPVQAERVQEVLRAIGEPDQWCQDGFSVSEGAAQSPAARERGRDDWYLAYVSLGLLLLAIALPPFLWIGIFGAFLTARASMQIAARRGREEARGQHWLRTPSLLLVYIPAMMLLLLWPAVAMRLMADLVVSNPELGLRLPIELAWVAERVAQFRLSNFDPGLTLQHALRSGHWLLFPVGLWLVVLAGLVRLVPALSARLFRPFFERSSRTLAGVLLFCGLLLGASALVLALLKQYFLSASLL